MKTSDLIFIGIKGSVIALNRATGEQVWATHLKGSSFVTVVLEDGMVLASCNGEVFCLDPLNGNGRWHNRLAGFGTGLASIASLQNPRPGVDASMAETDRRDQEAAAGGAAVC